MKSRLVIILAIVIWLIAASSEKADEKGKGAGKRTGSHSVDRPFWAPNRIGTYLTNEGNFVSHIPRGHAGMEWPVGSGKTINFASGIWIGGKKDGEIVTAAAEFVSEFQPGSVTGHASGIAGTPSDPDDPRFKVYIINEEDRFSPAMNADYMNWPVADGAPVDENGDPLLLGTSTVWAVSNDFNPELHQRLYQDAPMGVEVQMTGWAYERQGVLGDIMFFKFVCINKSGTDITDAYIALWSDTDIGDALVKIASDTTRDLGYAYKTQGDGVYGDVSPAFAIDLLQGPIVPSPGDTARVSGRSILNHRNLDMTSLVMYINAGPPNQSDPENAAEAYNYLQGLGKFGTPFVNPVTGMPSRYWAPGDPVAGTGWNQDWHGNIRFVLSSGPFTFADGDTQEIVCAVVIGMGESNLESVLKMRQNDGVAQSLYQNNFAFPERPSAPTVSTYEDPTGITLYWDNSLEPYVGLDGTDLDSLGQPTTYTFQGYNVYQLDAPVLTPDTKKERIVNFDVVDGVTQIRDDVFIPAVGQVANIVVQPAEDTGVQHFFRIIRDAFSESPLVLNKRYHFAVTGYVYNPAGDPRTLESPLNIITVRPQSHVPGTLDLTTRDFGDRLSVTRLSGQSDGFVGVMVIDPLALTSNDYRLSFRSDDSRRILWDVTTLAGETKIAGWENQGRHDELDFPIFDGLYVQVFGPPVGINFTINSVGPDDADNPFPGLPPGPDGNRWITGFNWGGAQFFGGLDLGTNFLSPTTVAPADYFVMDLNFTGNPTMSEESGWSRCTVMRRDLGYMVQSGLGWAPIQAFDMTDPANPRRVNIAFVEDADDGLADFIWNPIAAGAAGFGLGGREFIFFMGSDYNPATGGGYDDSNPPYAADALYALWPEQRGTRPYQSADFVMRIVPHLVNTEADTFAFRTTAPVTGNPDLARIQTKLLVNVYPNPVHREIIDLEDPFDQVVTFTHLPGRATIRIYNIYGDFVRKLEHTDGTQFEEWDLTNAHGREVATGIYIVHIDMGEIGVKVLKLGVL